MAIINRVARLFRADMHAVLDRVEEPEVQLRQAIREMEEDLARDEQQRKLVLLQRQQLQHRHEESDAALRELGPELDLCLDSGRDDLARGLLRRKLELQGLRQQLQARISELEQQAARLEERLHEHRPRLETMRQKAAILLDRQAPASVWNQPALTPSDEEIEVALLKEKQRRVSP